MPPDSNETELGNSNQGASPSAGKNTRVLLAPCCTWKCAPTAISSGVKDIAEVKMCFDFFINNISNSPNNVKFNFPRSDNVWKTKCYCCYVAKESTVCIQKELSRSKFNPVPFKRGL